MASKFGDQVRGFAEKAKQRQELIFRESAQKVMDEANTPEGQGGRMPVDTGFLRNSAVASTSGVPGSGGTEPALVFAQMQIGQAVWAGWTAAYALRMEHGYYGEDKLGRVYAQAGKGFLRAATQRWDFIVNEVSAAVKARIP
ncbi:hypothetical protein [Xanthomonas translucens]|uniref:hypothetical protein n=1 Tax=Xanthomonas campestris pv. translucens TaxID=343 RepID=UPI000AE80A64|nr:hypothetical protein [Xanthomonas translucens]UPU47753.1 hypothetical protein MZO50_13420 [Xanthomonas translucens pv. undulosa]WLA06559.1 hypothetical protein MO329_09920 [Xanthomonas translucens]